MKEMLPRNKKPNILGTVGTAALKSPLPHHCYPKHHPPNHDCPLNDSLNHDYPINDSPNHHSPVHDSPNHHLITFKSESTEDILEGSFYEIDHSQLPSKGIPAMFLSLRAVYVTAKSEESLIIRYPSTQSLEAFFGNVTHIAQIPTLDEKYIMGPELVKVLKRRISYQELGDLGHLKSFWLIDYYKRKHGQCFSKLQSSLVKGWGSQVQVSYRPVSELDNGLMDVKISGDGNESVKEEEFHETKVKEIIPYSRKRKRGRPPSSRNKKTKQVLKEKAIEVKAEFEGNNNKEYVDRWPTKRYEAAAKQLAEVLKEYGGIQGNPLSRFFLRKEARKRIGDTGLLDHLLKHLAGKVVPPDGKDRLRRRCDADGKMEYWLENADLANLRKEAGVNDPYWIPPPGWKLGDSISSPDCNCRKEIKILKDELRNMRSQMAELQTKNENEHPIAMVMPDSAQSFGKVRIGSMNGKETYESLMTKKCLMEEQLLQITKALKELEQEGMNLKSNRVESAERLQLLPNQSSPVEEMNEGSEEEDLSEAHGEDDENQRQNRRLIVKLKPCSRPDSISNRQSSQAVDRSGLDFTAPTSASGSPLSTTTS